MSAKGELRPQDRRAMLYDGREGPPKFAKCRKQHSVLNTENPALIRTKHLRTSEAEELL